jgi:hypothetical protein
MEVRNPANYHKGLIDNDMGISPRFVIEKEKCRSIATIS